MQIQHLHLIYLILRVFSLCLWDLRKRQEQIATDLSIQPCQIETYYADCQDLGAVHAKKYLFLFLLFQT